MLYKVSARSALIIAVLSLLPRLFAQNASTSVPVLIAPSSPSDTLILSGESDHIFPGIQGGSGSFEWLHATANNLMFSAGSTSDILGSTHWNLGQGGMVWFHSRWTIETSIRAGRLASSGKGYGYNDDFASIMYRAAPHLYPVIKEEYIDIATSHGSLLRAGVCVCNVHRFSTTLYAAHSLRGNLATEYVSLREETSTRLLSPFTEISVGKILPTLINPALDIHSASANTFTFTGGSRLFPLHRTNFTVAASYLRTGATNTLSIGVSMSIKVKGD